MEECLCGGKCKEFSLEGNSNDLYMDFPQEDYKHISLIKTLNDEDDSNISLILSSTDRSGNHELLSKFLNKKVKITIKVIEDA